MPFKRLGTLLSPGEATWLENPGYFGARGALLATGAQLVPVPVDEHGLMVEIGRKRCESARLVSTTPSHQFPTGVTRGKRTPGGMKIVLNRKGESLRADKVPSL